MFSESEEEDVFEDEVEEGEEPDELLLEAVAEEEDEDEDEEGEGERGKTQRK